MKKIRILVTVFVMLAVLAGCGGKSDSKNADATALGADLHSKITYQDDISEMDIDTASMFLMLDGINIVNSAIYESSGATAEEIVVLECASPADAKSASEAFKTRVAQQKESFENYVPEELTKLSSAVIATSGNFAVLSVSDDPDTAKKVISEYLK